MALEVRAILLRHLCLILLALMCQIYKADLFGASVPVLIFKHFLLSFRQTT